MFGKSTRGAHFIVMAFHNAETAPSTLGKPNIRF
jgi:hypothetical protein